MPEVATAAVVGGSLLSSGSAMAQGSANRDAAKMIALMAKDFGAEQLKELEGMDYDPVGLLGLLGDAETLVDFGFEQAREKAVGADNIDDLDQLQADALARANFDFESLPPDILGALDNSALARTAGGPAGLAENISLQNRMALADQGFNTFNAITSNNAQFTPNPVGTLFELGKFNSAQQQMDLDFDLRRIGQELAIEEFKFSAMAGAIQQRADNDAGAVGLSAAGSALSAIGGGFSSAGLSSATAAAGQSMQNTAGSVLGAITGR